MKAGHLIFVLAIVIVSLLLPCHTIQAEDERGACWKPSIRSILPRSGKAGDLVTIRGDRFGSVWGEVIFTHRNKIEEPVVDEEVKAETVNWTFTLIRVRVPESATTGPVFVRVRCGSESNKVDFTVDE
jgi:hypothetical protein